MRKISVLILATLLLMTAMNVMPVYADGETSPIYITSNAGFSAYATGSGIAGDPYVISGVVLESFGDACVYIKNTDAFAIIDDFYLNGTGFYGIYLENVSNLNMTNGVIVEKKAAIFVNDCSRIFMNTITITNQLDNDYGIKIDRSDNISVRNCNITRAFFGLILLNSFRVEIVDNTFIDSGISFFNTCQVSTSVVLTGNTVNGRPIGYLYNHHDARYDISSYGQAILVNCVNITLYNANIGAATIGVQFIFSQNCVIALSNITGNYFGVYLYESSYCRVYANNITANTIGLGGSFATGTRVDENNFVDNTQYGIWVGTGVSSSILYNNNFINNTIGNARDDGSIQESNLIWLSAEFINSVNGRPLANVSVTIQKDGRTYTGYSNEYGIFKVSLPELGAYNFTIAKFRYQTKQYINYIISEHGVHLYQIELDKANLGPGTGYVLARFMNGTVPIGGAIVKVYSYLDGAYYYHSQQISTTVTPIGWVNITGLYYDNYTFVITRSDFEQKILQQIIIADGLADTYNNIQMVANPTDAFVYGWIFDYDNDTPIVNANVTIYNVLNDVKTGFTDVNGFVNITNIIYGTWFVEISKSGYVTAYREFTISHGGAQEFCPFTILLMPTDYVPSEPSMAIVNQWDNGVVGNYWDDYSGLVTSIVVIADENIYEIPGDNLDNPIDEYPLLSPYSRLNDNNTSTADVESVFEKYGNIIILVTMFSVIGLVIILFVLKRKNI